MPPGGARVGRPGVNYPNRSDMGAGDRTYGDQVNQARIQTATPGSPGPGPGEELVKPGQLTPLSAPSSRPNEPVTSGLDQGAGPGPEILGQLPIRGASDDLFELRALYRMFPNEDLRRLIQAAEDRL